MPFLAAAGLRELRRKTIEHAERLAMDVGDTAKEYAKSGPLQYDPLRRIKTQIKEPCNSTKT